MNRLESLKIFCTLAETLHFKETANRLAVSPQVITRVIHELEQELGEVLFVRSTRQVKLSDFGRQFLPDAERLLADADALFANAKIPIAEQSITGVIRIAVPDMAIMQEVLKITLEKLTPYPDLMIDWRADYRLADVVDEQIDVGIRFGTPDDSRLIVKKVGTADDCIVATPALLDRIGTPKDWADLQKNYPLSAIVNPNTGRAWAWYLSNQYQFTPSKPKFLTTHLHNELTAVLAHQTIACLPRLMCREYLASGELIEIFPKIKRKQWDAYVYRPSRSVTHPRVKVAFDVLACALGEVLGQSES